MAPLSLKVVQDNGAVIRTVKVESKASVEDALQTVLEKFMIPDDGKAYGLFLTAADNDRSGVWLESFRNVEYYMLRDGDTLLLLCKTRNLRLRMLDGSVKTLQVDESQPISQMMIGICARIGITNHDEYGLCYDNNEDDTESKVTATGTLTLKRPPHQEKDAKLEHMSKKLKTDDNVQWLDMHRTLREMEVGLGDTLLLKRRLFYTDRNVDARDPVQLNLLYVQTRDAILCGRHPVTVDQACEFAGIQCQIQYGDYQDDKHKPGFFELKELLPDNVSNKSGLEKKIIKEFKKHQGLSNVEAKHLYTKTARDMPTYGVTFFVVKEKQAKGKKKLVPRLLGISANAVLRLDEETKEILQAWPLTQVMSYQVGKSHTFTLNFGDYSDKEYSVKTNDAVRIRDILQGYIDIIARRLAGAHNSSMNDGASIVEDSIQVSKGTTMQFVKNDSNKIVEECFVGPTKIMSYEPGQTVSQGTQVLTAQQLIITSQANRQQYQTSGEVPLRKEMSLEFVRKLNRMNTHSVRIVNLITSADGPHNAELKTIVNTMENDMPVIASGVNEILKKDMEVAAKKRLEDELRELGDHLKTLSKNVYGPDPSSDESLEAASRIADVSTQMYLGLDPLTKRRSGLVRLSRQSFIEDEKVQANLHRASFIAAAAGACSAVDNASLLINQEYTGPALSASQVEALERNARDNMRKLNGAVALLLAAHAEPQNIDYSAAVTSMNTINELMLELAKDGQALASTKDGASKQELIDDINKLCDATRLVCSLTGSADHQKMQDVTSVYGPVADKLIFTFGRGRRDDRNNRIIDLAKDVGEKTSLLLVKATELTGLAPAAPAARELDDVGVQCAAAASNLLACAMLTSPCIHEPHCQSALTASAETLSTAAQRLLVAAKPLVEEQSMKHHGDDLRERSLELAKALDALKNAYGNDEQMEVEASAAKERQRLKFVMRLGDTNKGLDEAVKELNKTPIAARQDHSPVVVAMLEKNLAQRMAEYNSAIAALLVATSDRDNPDYEDADSALNTISELMTVIVKDTKALAASRDRATREAMLEDLKKLCEATRGICAGAGSGDIGEQNESAATLANTSNKLYFTFKPSAPADKEQEILDIATAACTKASEMLANVHQLAEQTEGKVGEELDAGGVRTADAAKALLTCAQLTAACIDNPACQDSLIKAADALSESSAQVANTCSEVNSPLVAKLCSEQKELEAELEKLRRACRSRKGLGAEEGTSKFREMQRLKFVKSMSAAKAGLLDIQSELHKPYDDALPKGEAATMRQHHLSKSLARLNAALAALAAATSDPDNPDYEAANAALATISETIPLVVRETKAMASTRDEDEKKALMEELQKLCDATQGVCETVHQDPDKLREFAKDLSAASGKLVFVFNPRADPATANQVMKQAYDACTTADQIVRDANKLADQLPASDDTAEKLRLHADKTRNAADSLMTSAQLTAASVSDPACQSALLSSVHELSTSAQQLSQQWTGVPDELLVRALNKEHDSLQQQLDAMRRDYSKKRSSSRKSVDGDRKRQQFAKAAAAAKKSLADIEKDGIFSAPYNEPLPAGEAALSRQHHLFRSLAALNAALAALAAATADPENPDYAAANEAMAVISETMPLVVKETKVMASMKPTNERDVMLEELQKLCDATRGVCDTAHQDPHKLREFAKEFAKSSGKLVFVLNPQQRPADANQVVDQAQEACRTADKLVNAASSLCATLPAMGLMAESEALRQSAENTAQATDALYTSAQLTAPSIDDFHCKAALSSSVGALSSSAQHLAQQWAPLHGKADETVIKALEKTHEELQHKLENMRRDYCTKPSRVARSAEEERQRQQFAKSTAAANKSLADVEKELTKPYNETLPKGEAALMRQHHLSRSLAALNAALAALAAATADPQNPDYAAANEAMAVISETMPLVVKETKVMASMKPTNEKNIMLEELQKLCDATRGVCDTAHQEPHKLREFAKEFANSSGKLVFVLNPRQRPADAIQVIDQVQGACKTADKLVNDASSLSAKLPAMGLMAESEALRQSAENTAQATDALYTSAQLTAPSIDDPHCQVALSSSVGALSSSVQHLAQQWAPLHGKTDETVIKTLDKTHVELQRQLENIRRDYCRKLSRVARSAEEERQRQQFAKSAAAANKSLADVEKELTKPHSVCLAKSELSECGPQLGDAMARLAAAVAALHANTADPENPDYVAADEAMATITELMPLVVKDTKAVASTKEDNTREAIMSDLHALCEATRDICGAQHDPRLLRESAKKFSAASGKLVSVINPHVAPAHVKQIMSQADYACNAAKQLASDSCKLADQLSSEDAGTKIRHAAGRTVEASEALLIAAQLTSPTLEDPRCQSVVLSSVDGLSLSAHQLSQQWAQVHDKNKQSLVMKLEKDHGELQLVLENIRKECTGDDNELRPVTKEERRVHFTDSVAAAKRELVNIEEELSKPYTGTLPSGEAKASRQLSLSNSLAKLNAALAALAAATADPDNTDYAAADEAMKTIHETLPLVVQDTKAMAVVQDDITREVMLGNAKALCLATQEICDSAERDPAALRNFAKDFAAASGKLVYVVNARSTPTTASQVMEATQEACKTAKQLVKNSFRLADQLGASDVTGFNIRSSGGKTLDAADTLMTVAQLTAPCIRDPHCQSSLATSVHNLSSSSRELRGHWSPLLREPILSPVARELETQHRKLAAELDRLRSFCVEKGVEDEKADEQRIKETQKNQYIAKAAAAKEAMLAAEKELDKQPAAGAPTAGERAAAARQRLSQRLAGLHAALLALSVATSDNNNPDYVTAEKSIDTIRELTHHVVKDTSALLTSKDSKDSHSATVEELRALCRGARDLCHSAQHQDSAKLNDQLTKNVIPRLNKLYYVVNPNVGAAKLPKVEACAKSAGGKASQLLTNVFQLAEAASGETTVKLDNKGAATADAAKALLIAVQLTGPYIHEPEAQSTLISVADALSSSARDIASVWQPLIQDPKHKDAEDKLTKDLQELEAELAKFKKACKESEPESIVHKPTTKPKPLPPPRKPDDEELKKKQFTSTLEMVTHSLQAAKEDIKRIYNAKLDAPQMHKDQVRGVQKALERKIALSNVATSALVACNATEPMDYATAAKHSSELANLVPKIAQDAKVLSNTLSEKEKKTFLDDILTMFDLTRKVIEAAQNDRKSLNGAAVEYGMKSGALLYTVCTDFDPSHEKEVISRAKDIGDSVSKITLCSAQLMSDTSTAKASELCAAGKACAAAAGNLVYTAKLVAPSIQVAECQEVLKHASEALSTKIAAFSSAWQPLADDPDKKACVEELNEQTAKAEGLLEELRKDLESGKLVKMRAMEQLVVEETPLRKLTAALIENAMKKASNSSLPPEQKRAFVEYARALTDASEHLDRANALCKKQPHNLEKSRELEEAVQNLQVLALQARPSLGNQQQQYIVDLTEYVKELSEEAKGMVSTIDTCSVKHKEINTTCQKIAADAEKILHPSHDHHIGDGVTVDDMYEVDRFGRSTDERVKDISSQIRVLPDSKDKTVLNSQAVILEDSCNILRFATQSAVATTQSASLDETLHDLIDLEKRIDSMLQNGDKPSRCVDEPIPWSARSSLLQATRGIASQPQLCTAITQYVDEQKARTDSSDPEANHKLKEHIRKLTYLLRILVVETSRRVATWQELDGPEVASVMEQVLKEIDIGCNLNQSKKQDRSVLQNVDLNRLLLSTDVIKIEGDRKHIEDKMQQTATKLTSMLSTVMASSGKPESMVRSLTVTADTAGELAALARALKKPDDPVYNAKIEEAVREATFQTYNVLKASELVSQEPKYPAYRRRLLDACRMLNDALNNLGRTTSPDSHKLQRECSELSRTLLLQHTLLQATQPTCALPYSDCLDALQNQQEVLQKLSSDQPMSRSEFSRTLSYISSAVCNSTELAAHCGYLPIQKAIFRASVPRDTTDPEALSASGSVVSRRLKHMSVISTKEYMSLSERDQEATKTGVVDVQQLKKVTEAAQATCYRMLQFDAGQAKEEAVHLTKQTQDLCSALLDAEKKSQHLKEELSSAAAKIDRCTKELNSTLQGQVDKAKMTTATTHLLDSIKTVSVLTDHPSLVPISGNVPAEARERAEHVMTAARDLTTKTASLVRDVKTRAAHGNDDDDEPMTWVTFNLKRKDVVKAFEALLASVRENGQRAGILEVEQQEAEEEAPKSFVQIQVELANKWLKRPNCKPEVKASGEDAVRKVLDIAEKMVVDMKENEKEDVNVLINESKELLSECTKKCTPDKASLLVERLKALKKAIERGVITMVVEDLIEGEEPLQDLEILVDSESDESKRKFLLERKIAELLAQLSRVSRTARVVASAGVGGQKTNVEITRCTEQANLLAPLLVKAAQERINTPDDKAAIDNYKSLLAQYAESLSKVRDLCDQSVDPMEFVQTAGETMQRMREESSHDNDPQKCVYTSTAITKLANRVIQVSMSSNNAKEDPELRKALSEAQQRLRAAAPGPHARRSTMPDWKDTTAEILRTTGRVEAVMGGEMIFQNQPQSDQPIFAAARELHAAVREWSARDNEIVGVAKRMAVLMAKLSAFMNTNKKHELIVTSKSIVSNSHEVAELARKLAHECTDVRIKTNLLQVCDRIPTISGQLKMLTTVKGSTLARQGNKEDQESLNMLVDNAQNLMLSIQEVVKVSAGASVAIASQRGGMRVRWVRRNYYY